MLHREKPYECYFETIISHGIRKKCYYFNTLFTKPNGSPSKGNLYKPAKQHLLSTPSNEKNIKKKETKNPKECGKRKKARHVTRTTEVLKKIAPDWSEGRICEEDLCGDIVKEL